MLLSFLQQEGDVLFQQDNACPHTAAVMQHALYGVQLSWPARSSNLIPIEHIWDMSTPVVILLTSGSEVRGFDPGRGQWIFFRA